MAGRDEEIEAAATVALAGMDVEAYLLEQELDVQAFTLAIATRTLELRRLEQEAQADLIAERVGRLFGG